MSCARLAAHSALRLRERARYPRRQLHDENRYGILNRDSLIDRRPQRSMKDRSYYFATAHPSPTYPPLEGSIDADVCVIGGGIAGCSTALNLAERGYRVVLLEGRHIGWGASGRSGGQAL